jgi:hypothetical protein
MRKSAYSKPPRDESCGGCSYYFQGATPEDYLGLAGECRAAPPLANNGWGAWPRVPEDGWCAAFSPALVSLEPR